MPSTRIAYPEIQSWTPAVEAKAAESGSLFVLRGENYFFTSRGPRSFYGTTVLADMQISSGVYPTDSITTADRSFLLTNDKVVERRWPFADSLEADALSQYWFQMATLQVPTAPRPADEKWTHAYVGYANYLCHPQHGLFKIGDDTLSPYAGTTDSPEDVISVIENNGRLVIMSKGLISWSAPFDGDDLTPALGGAGFQVIAELIPGSPLAMTNFEGGFLVWTDGGVLIAEYNASDSVYRWDRLNTEQLLYGGASWCSMADGATLIVTKSGLQRVSSTGQIEQIAPAFNEWLRPYLTERDDLVIRPVYIQEEDLLFLQMMDNTGVFNQTPVLSVNIDKWGYFNENHYGFVRIDADEYQFGYVDYDGYVRQIHEGCFNEDAAGNQSAIQSWVELGFIRPIDGSPVADANFEIQEVVTTVNQTRTIEDDSQDEDWNGPNASVSWNIGFYSDIEDWNKYGLLDYGDDWGLESVLSGPEEDWNLLPSTESADWGEPIIGPTFFDWNNYGAPEDWGATPSTGVEPVGLIDWQLSLEADEDWGGPQASLNHYNYQFKIISDLDGWDEELVVEPALAIRKPDTDVWTCFSHGHNHRLRYSTSQIGDKFHIRTLAMTIHSSGQQI
jgi:hypothetical protein